jgi:hypothetical protein
MVSFARHRFERTALDRGQPIVRQPLQLQQCGLAPSRAPANGRPGATANGSGSTYRRAPKPEGVLWGKVNGELKRQAIRDLTIESGLVLMEGEIFSRNADLSVMAPGCSTNSP